MTVASPVRHRRASGPSLAPAAVVAGCLLVSVASLALPAAIGFDPWAWLVWGRQVVDLDLDTTGGPSWKPLPVMITTVLAVTGDAAPLLWVVVARTAGLLLVVGVVRLASRFAGPVAGVLAAGLLVLTPDGEPRFVRTLLEAHGTPMAAALAIWAIDRHLEGRRTAALALVTGLALMRPESWPLLALYGAWLWRPQPSSRRLVTAGLVAVPVLWFGGDLWGAGHPLHGADAAQVAAASLIDRTAEAFGTAAGMVAVPVWAAAVAAVVVARRRGERELVLLAALALGWSAIVVGMAITLRYAAISRFFLPAAAVVTVLGAIGAVRVVKALPTTPASRAAAVAAGSVAVALLVPRVAGLADVASEVHRRAELQDGLGAAIASAGGPATVLACGAVAVDGWSLLRPAVAWELHVPLAMAARVTDAAPGVWFTTTGGRTDRLLSWSTADVLARSDTWTLYRVGCPGEAP